MLARLRLPFFALLVALIAVRPAVADDKTDAAKPADAQAKDAKPEEKKTDSKDAAPEVKKEIPGDAKKDEPKKDEPKKEEPKKPEPKKEDPKAPKKDDGKKEEPKKEEPKKEEPKKEEPKKEEKPKPAPAQAPPKDDPDFALQGEFVGQVAVGPGKSQKIGLQLRPLGAQGFEAIQYEGGLPGEEGFAGKPVTLVGKRFEDAVVLSGGPYVVVVERDRCYLADRKGTQLGYLERVHRKSPTMGAKPPAEAIVLFNGHGAEQFINGQVTSDHLLAEGTDFLPMMQDFDLHAEFLLPYMPAARDQGRGNSGFYLHSRYEVQVLDSFATEAVFNGCGSLYRFKTPDFNMCLPPLEWQTYDIQFTAARWGANQKKLKNARITVYQNGVKIHDNVELEGPTGAGKPEEPNLQPIKIQNHGNPVRFRNIWIVDRGAAATPGFPVTGKAEDKPAEEKKAEPKKAEKKGEEKKSDDKKPEEKKDAPKPEPEKKDAATDEKKS